MRTQRTTRTHRPRHGREAQARRAKYQQTQAERLRAPIKAGKAGREGTAITSGQNGEKEEAMQQRAVTTDGVEFFYSVEDTAIVESRRWKAKKKGETVYVIESGRNKRYLHQHLIGEYIGVIDHKDGNGLNNTRKNIRVVTQRENRQNSKKALYCSSKYVGVYFRKDTGRWCACIGFRGRRKQLHLGSYLSETDAAEAYNLAALLLFGPNARFNDTSSQG